MMPYFPKYGYMRRYFPNPITSIGQIKLNFMLEFEVRKYFIKRSKFNQWGPFCPFENSRSVIISRATLFQLETFKGLMVAQLLITVKRRIKWLTMVNNHNHL